MQRQQWIWIALIAAALTMPAAAQVLLDKLHPKIAEAIFVEIKRDLFPYLKDPRSLQVRRLRPSPYVVDAVCGEFNERGPLGGYGGFRRFFWRPGAMIAEVSPADVRFSVYQKVLDNSCD